MLGCGKTPIKEEKAKENKGPFTRDNQEVLSNGSGNSLLYNETLLVKKDGIIKKVSMKDIDKEVNKERFEVVSFDENFNVKFTRVDRFFSYLYDSEQKIYKVRTKTGRTIHLTEDHSLFTIKEGKVISQPLSKLRVGEYIAIPSLLPLNRRFFQFINLFDYFEDDEIFVLGAEDLLEQAINDSTIKEVQKILEINRDRMYYLRKRRVLRKREFDKLVNHFGYKFDNARLRFTLSGSKYSIPAKFELTEDFYQFIGLWIAEGDFIKNSIRISNTLPEVQTFLIRFAKLNDLGASRDKNTVTINSALLLKIMKRILKLRSGAINKSIPDLVFSSSRTKIDSFLRGYITGDGSVYGNSHRYYIEAGTISKNLATDLMYLFLMRGIVVTIDEKKERSGNITYRIRFSGVENFKRFAKIGFLDKKRNSIVQDYLNLKKWSRTPQIPITNPLRHTLIKVKNNWKNSKTIGKKQLEDFLKKEDPEHTNHLTYWRLLKSNIYWDQIISIEESLGVPEKVYTISVPARNNFVAGIGGVYVYLTRTTEDK